MVVDVLVVAVKGDMMRLSIEIDVHRGVKRAERRNKETLWRMWRTVGDWQLSGIVSLEANRVATCIYYPMGSLLQIHFMRLRCFEL